MYLTLGFKSVTMDDIANEMGISKKTIYQHFANKHDLVEAVTMQMFDTISCGIDEICLEDKNPITEIFEIKNFVMQNLKDEKASPIYQLQKYFPKTFKCLRNKQFEKMEDCVIRNLRKGIELGLYRNDLNLDFVSRIYYSGIHSTKDKEIFPDTMFNAVQLEEMYLEYHLRGIITEKGLKILEKITNKSN
jgi:AcrR family transcriptional regulator